MWFNICLLVAVFAARCEGGTVQNNKQKLIYGGSPLPITEAPYMAQYLLNDSTICGASIIHKNFVLSAAHCYRPAQKQHIRVGSDKVNEGERYDIKKTIVHPEYNKKTEHDNDVLVIMLSRPLQFSDSVQPIQMAPRNLVLNSGDMLMTMGFGRTEELDISPILLSVKVPYVTNKDCIDIYKKDNQSITEQMMCAGGVKGDGSCNGDCGSPLVHNNLLVGTVSFGYNFCGLGLPAVYTRVSAVRDFIETTMDQLNNVYDEDEELRFTYRENNQYEEFVFEEVKKPFK